MESVDEFAKSGK